MTAGSAWVPPRAWLEEPNESVRPAVLLLATLLAALLRWPGLGDHPLWIDEFLTWKLLDPALGAGFLEQVRDGYQSPLLIALLWPLTRDGMSEWALRLPSALAGVAAVPLFGLLADRLAGRRTAEWAAVLLAVSPFHLWYSQDGRGYALLMLGAVVSTLVLVRLMRRGPDLPGAVGYGLSAGLMILSNNSGLFLVAAHAVAVLLTATPRGRRSWLVWTAAFGTALLVALPWLLRAAGILAVDRLAPGAGTGAALRAGQSFTPLALPYTFHSFWYGFSLGPSLFELHRPDRTALVMQALPVLAPAWAVAALLAAGGWWRLRARVRLATLLWVLIPLALVTLLAVRNVKAFNPRYAAVALPAVLLLTAHGAAAWGRAGRWLGVVYLAFALVATGGYLGFERYAREDVRAAAAWIDAHGAADEPVLVPVVSGLYGLYARNAAPVIPFWTTPVIRDDAAARAALAPHLEGRDAAWLLLCRSWDLDPGDRLPAALGALGAVEVAGRWPGVRLLRWDRSDENGRTP